VASWYRGTAVVQSAHGFERLCGCDDLWATGQGMHPPRDQVGEDVHLGQAVAAVETGGAAVHVRDVLTSPECPRRRSCPRWPTGRHIRIDARSRVLIAQQPFPGTTTPPCAPWLASAASAGRHGHPASPPRRSGPAKRFCCSLARKRGVADMARPPGRGCYGAGP